MLSISRGRLRGLAVVLSESFKALLRLEDLTDMKLVEYLYRQKIEVWYAKVSNLVHGVIHRS